MLKRYLNADVIPQRVNISLLILRLSLGGMMLTHGTPKMGRLLSGEMRFADPIGLGEGTTLVIAVMAEFIGSLMIITGAGTRFGALLGALTMLVAALIVHAEDPFGTKEKALLFLAGYLVILVAGAGKYSVDSRWSS